MTTFNIIKASEAVSKNAAHAKILIWGSSGVGKTWMVSDSPKPLIVLTEPNGALSIANSNPNADIVIINKAEDLRNLVVSLRKNKTHNYETIVFDSLTECQRLIKDEILGAREDLSLRDWGKLASKTLSFIRTIRDLPYHIICTALSSNLTDQEGGIVRTGPSFDGKKTGNEIMQYFSAVGALYQKETQEGAKRFLMFTGPQRYMIKPCADLTGTLEDPNMKDMISKLSGAIKNASKKTNNKK